MTKPLLSRLGDRNPAHLHLRRPGIIIAAAAAPIAQREGSGTSCITMLSMLYETTPAVIEMTSVSITCAGFGLATGVKVAPANGPSLMVNSVEPFRCPRIE